MFNRPHWSYSAISQYLACPLRYYFQRVLCLPQPSVSGSLVLGSSVHLVLAEYHRAIRHGEPTAKEQLHQVFKHAWSRRENGTRLALRNGESASDFIDQGIALIELYLNEPPPQHIVAIEQEIISPVHNSRGEYLETPLVAIADLITAEQEEIRIEEFKTSGRAYSQLEADTSLQPTCYVNAAQEFYGRRASVEYTVLVKTKTPKIQRLKVERADSDLGRLGDIIENIELAVRSDIFYPVESPLNCSTCPFRHPCREWGRGSSSALVQFSPPLVEAGAC
jgi:CRISPR/Cas system-associated exonuclease Cas4 (RecB family)